MLRVVLQWTNTYTRVGLVLVCGLVTPIARAQPLTDSLKVLIVFVKFADDQEPGDPSVSYREWPLFTDPSTLPHSAPFLLSESPDPPFGDSTLTAYFHRQSLGRMVVFGDVYPRTMVTDGPETDYHKPKGGYGTLSAEILNRLDRGGVDFSDYDYNRDGIVDHVFLILRRDSEKDARKISWTGASCLDARCANGPPVGSYIQPLTLDGVLVDWNLSGSIIFNRVPGNVLPHYWLVRMMAHEIGHDFWRRFFIHIPAITSNDVPAASNYDPATNVVGYALMAGAGGGRDASGDATISAFERHLLGWIDCPTLSVDAEAVRMRDLYTTGDCRRVTLGVGPHPRELFLSNRQRIGPFDRYRKAGVRSQFEMGLLRTTGLLIGLAERYRYEVLPADNSLVLSVENKAYQGDLFGPGSSTQITPWTRPTINGYTTRRIRHPISWQAIDNIRTDPADRSVVLFDYVADFRSRPVIREESWMAWETSGETIDGPVVITNGAKLTVSADVTFNRRVLLQPGTTLHVERGARLTLASTATLSLADSARLRVDGALVVDGIVIPQAGSKVEIGEDGQIRRGSGR